MKPVSRFLTSVLLSALVAGPALAQRAEQIEINGYGSYTRYDRAFLLQNQAGGGVRIGYYTSNRVGFELEGGYSKPVNVNGFQAATLSLASASLVLNFPAGKTNEFYILGGYTRLTFGDTPPYKFTDNGLHGAIGDRVFFGQHWALRLEGKAIWSPKTNFPSGTWGGQVIGSAGLSYFLIPPAGTARIAANNYQWFWGAQGGAFISKTNAQGTTYDPMIGGHWLITARRTALYIAYEQAVFLGDDPAVIADPNSSTGLRDVTFHDMRRLMFGVLAFPTQKVIEPFAGGGFALMQVLNPVVDCSSGGPNADCGASLSDEIAAQDRAEEASSKAFFWLSGGVQISYGKLSVFGQYILTSSARGFLLDGTTHSLQGGVRYSLGTAKEGVTERN